MARCRLIIPLAKSLLTSALDAIRESTERSRVVLLIGFGSEYMITKPVLMEVRIGNSIEHFAHRWNQTKRTHNAKLAFSAIRRSRSIRMGFHFRRTMGLFR